MSKGDPIPTRFDPPEDEAIEQLRDQTGLSGSEIVRRAVRLLALEVKSRKGVGFILEELAPRIAEDSPPYRAKKRKRSHG